MKKLVLAAMVLGGLALTSCKKDRVCECGTQVTVKDASGTNVSDTKTTTKTTIVDASRRTAFSACVHSQWETDNALGGKTKYDANCDLK